MRATCTSCEAVYEVPDRLVGPGGRRLRCANCGNEWTLLPPPPEAPPAAPPSPPSVPAAPLPPAYAYAPAAEPPQQHGALPPTRPMLRRPPQVIDPPLPPVDDGAGFRQRGEIALRVAWVGSVLLVVFSLVTLWTFRHEIATAWPPAARLVGTPVSGG